MKMHPDWVLSITLGYMVMAALMLWQVQEGMDPVAAVAIGVGSAGIVGLTIWLSLPKWERMRAQQLEESRRGFPWRRFLHGNGLAAIFVGMFAVGGADRATLRLDAALLFGLGNLTTIVHWLMQRHAARCVSPEASDGHGASASHPQP